jgi:hypothetical protein
MKTLKLITIIALALLIQSCNMAKHYGNMRINHSSKNVEKSSTNAVNTDDKNEASATKTKLDSMKSPDTEHKPETCSETASTLDTIPAKIITKNSYPKTLKKLNKQTNKSIPAKIIGIAYTKVKTHKASKNFRNPLKKASAAKWIDVDSIKTQILLCLGGATILVLVLAIAGVGSVGQIILWGLVLIGVVFAGALAFGLLIMGFLRMCGLDW